MKIIIDNLIFSWQKSGGISVVWHEIIKRLLREDAHITFLEYDDAQQNSFRKRLAIPMESIKRLSKTAFQLKRYLPVRFAGDKPFIFHSTYYRVCTNSKAVNFITVHDFTYEYFRKGLKQWIHTKNKCYAIRHADCVICISENTKRDLLKFVPDVDEHKVRVVYNGVGEAFKPLKEENRYDGKDDFILFVGGRSGYKNFKLAVEAARISGTRLVIVGKSLSDDERSATEASLGTNYSDVAFVDDERLNALYNKALALIYPSSYEGFGIPVIEAQKAGCPVVAMNRSSIPEIIGNKELLVDEESPALFAEKLHQLKDAGFRRHIIEEGLENAKRFNWDATYAAYKRLYSELSPID